jgi:hypothetical protein
MTRAAALLGCSLALFCATSALADSGPVYVGAAKVDGTYNVGSSAGQYASTRDGGYGNYDPHVQQVKNQASYGVQSRESVRAIVIKGADGKYAAIVSDDHYIPQDALWRRTAQLASAATGGALNETNITMSITHNHSSPSYSSLDAGVWTFQDVFDFRFYDYYASQNAKALADAFKHLHLARVSATAVYFDKTQRNPLGAGRADDGAPAGFTDSFADHDLSVIRFENIDDGADHAKPLATLLNMGQHPEFLQGYDLITSEYPGVVEKFVDRAVGGITMWTQNATGNTEIEQETYHSIHEREAFDHTQYAQDEWAGRQIADAAIGAIRTQIDPQVPNPDTHRYFGMASYQDRFIPWMSNFPVEVKDVWFPGPVSHPYPGVNSCRTDPALAGDPRVGSAASCDSLGDTFGVSPQPIVSALGLGITTDTFEQLGIPIPENFSTPSHGALEDTIGVHMQGIRLGDLLITVCSCEQWTDQAYDIKTRLDTIPGNQWLGYDAANPPADDPEHADDACTQSDAADKHWTCHADRYATAPDFAVSDHTMQLYRSRTLNDAKGWDDPNCKELGCGLQAESEPTDLSKIRGNYTHDDTTTRGGTDQTQDYADSYGYKMVVTMSMANDYNGYIATYRDYMGRDHYRKALTGWGPHSSDFYATRLTRIGHALKGDSGSQHAIDVETDPTVAAQDDPAYAPGAARELADQKHEEAKVTAIGQTAAAGVAAYDKTVPDDGLGAPTDYKQPKDIQRFDAATFTWVGGNNYDDNPDVTVQRKVGDHWETFGTQEGEVETSLRYPASDPSGLVTYRAGGQVWKWTATFEAFVTRFPTGEVDPQGNAYWATPAGEYRFLVSGVRRESGAKVPYSTPSDSFTVRPWSGITVEHATADANGISFDAGPTHTATEGRIRGTSTHDFQDLTFDIGPVDFPDTAANQKATGFAFLNHERGYSANSPTDAEQYCLDCRFHDWLDATGDLKATVNWSDGTTDTLHTTDGHFAATRPAGADGPAEVSIEDSWGDNSGAPVAVQ